MRLALLTETAAMALETLRANKLQSALTILGVVIGITSIVGVASLIRGFDESLRATINALGPNVITLVKVSPIGLTSGADFAAIMRRPNLTVEDAKAIEKLAPSVNFVDVWLSPRGEVSERLFYRGEKTRGLAVIGATEEFANVNFVQVVLGRFFTPAEVEHRRHVVVLGNTAYEALFEPSGTDPIGKRVRVGAVDFTVVGVLEKRPSPGGFNVGADNFVVIPQTTHQKLFGTRASRGFFRGGNSAQIVIVPHDFATRDQAVLEVEEIMRIRHGLKLDEPNDFEMVTRDAVSRLLDRITGAVFLVLVTISSIALMVGGIGVMAIMMISVTERTREIGVRKALGARRYEVLFQFLAEAVVVTSIGGLLGILIGSGVALGVHYATGFPVSLPWWSFAIGIGFSAGVGIFFGMFPAVRASRLDPIEALRHE
jgi:putative ABC transport system permease protein